MVRHDLRHYRYLSYVDVDRCYYKLHHAHVQAVLRQHFKLFYATYNSLNKVVGYYELCYYRLIQRLNYAHEMH